jgi:hypothetical protein
MIDEMPELNRRQLGAIIERDRPHWDSQQVDRAVEIADVAFKGLTTCGDAANIGIRVVTKQDGK